jgi:RES domain-containing protein
MVLWRMSRFIDLKRIGGLRSSGRWHEVGVPAVYLAESPAGALIEVCVHTSSNDVPPTYTLLRVEGPDTECLSIPSESLPPEWMTKPRSLANWETSGFERERTFS